MSGRYSNMNDMAVLGFLVNAIETRGRGDSDGDHGASFPRSDAEDLSRGCRFIPGEVTMASRRGERVQFVGACGQCCWYWAMTDGSRIYHFERSEYEAIKRWNNAGADDLAGPCPKCGNRFTNGGHITPEQIVSAA